MDRVDREITVARPPDEVWPALADPERLGEWMDAEVELELRPGGGGSFRFDDGEVRRALVQAVEPGRRLSFAWWPAGTGGAATSTVTITLTPDDAGGTILRVRESRTGSLRAAA